MKDISIGIYHKDHQYGKRLMEYLNHQKDFPMTASFTSDEEMFFKQEQEGDFECLVLAEETDYHGDFPVCRIGANESMGGMYCQSAKEIAAGIYHCLNVSPQIENERIYGVYSPIPRLEISEFARNMAASNGWIYFGMQPYGHFEEDETDDLLLFYIKEHKEDIVLYFMEHQKKFDGCVGFAGALCYLDYREQRQDRYDHHIYSPVLNYIRRIRHQLHERSRQENTYECEKRPAEECQPVPVACCKIGLIDTSRAESPGYQRVDSHACTHTYRDEQHLYRENICHGSQSLFTQKRYEETVHYIVERLYEHRQYCRPRHAHYQPAYRHLSHLISFIHCLSSVRCDLILCFQRIILSCHNNYPF